MNKKLIIGIDGASWEVLDLLINEGKLNTLARFKKQNHFKPLKSTIPPLTGPAWITFATGKNPGEHGVFGFTLPEKSLSNLVPIDSTHVSAHYFSEILSSQGKRVISVNMPGSYPPRTNDITITSFLTPSDKIFYPEAKRSKYEDIMQRYTAV